MSHSSPPDQSASDPALSSPSDNHEAWRCLLAVEQKLQDLTIFQTNTASALQNITQQLSNVAATLQNMSTAPPASQANPQAHELDVEATASLALESESYYQHKHNIDVYIDSFQSLYRKTGYPDGHYLIMKFHHGLSKWISDHLGNITTGCPDDTCIEAWMTAACKQAFIMKTEADFLRGRFAIKPGERMPATIPAPFRPLPPPIVHPMTAAALPVPKSLPMGVPMDIDKMRAARTADV
ncbi:hypothetical protein DXG03_003049, partial [Asterophora parasitica]